jgi:glucose 1-dehydrogenase
MKDPALMKKLNSAIPLGRVAQPEAIASVVAFLAGDGCFRLNQAAFGFRD